MNKPVTNLQVILADELFHYFVPLLQQGVFVKAKIGGSIKSFLCETLSLSPPYIEKRIQTVFVDGNAVDDWDRTVLSHGSTLALSAAAPGLAGAILRRQGPLAILRKSITHGLEKGTFGEEEGIIGLKLFNLLVGELGPLVLEKGILLRGKDLGTFLKNLPAEFWTKCREARVDGKEVGCKALRETGGLSGLDSLGFIVQFVRK